MQSVREGIADATETDVVHEMLCKIHAFAWGGSGFSEVMVLLLSFLSQFSLP